MQHLDSKKPFSSTSRSLFHTSSSTSTLHSKVDTVPTSQSRLSQSITPLKRKVETHINNEILSLESELKCPACKDFYEVPMSSKCHHTFCAKCTKFDADNKSTGLCCPICGYSFASFSQIYKNTLIEEFVKEFKANRESIMRLYEVGKNSGGRTESVSTKREPYPKIRIDWGIDDDDDSNGNDNNGQNNKRSRVDDNDSLFPNKCMKTSDSKKKPKVAYGVMTEKKLRFLLKEEGLLSHGTKNEMIARHSYYVNLYNSNVDATEPKSKGELLREMRNWENAQQSHEAKNANSVKKSLTNQKEIDYYAIKYHDHYNELIQQARENKERSTSL